MTLEKLENDLNVKKAVFETLDFQVKTLKGKINPLQWRIYYERRTKIRKEVKELTAKIESYS